jgi:hypothetical protein
MRLDPRISLLPPHKASKANAQFATDKDKDNEADRVNGSDELDKAEGAGEADKDNKADKEVNKEEAKEDEEAEEAEEAKEDKEDVPNAPCTSAPHLGSQLLCTDRTSHRSEAMYTLARRR